jgi:hypothetical protein
MILLLSICHVSSLTAGQHDGVDAKPPSRLPSPSSNLSQLSPEEQFEP